MKLLLLLNRRRLFDPRFIIKMLYLSKKEIIKKIIESTRVIDRLLQTNKIIIAASF